MNNKVIIICGDIPRDQSGEDFMDYARLKLDGHQASIELLHYYFTNNKNIDEALNLMHKNSMHKHILANGIYLRQYLQNRGFVVKIVQLFTLEKDRLSELLTQQHLAVVLSTSFITNTLHIDEIAGFVKEKSPDSILIAGGLRIWKNYLIKKDFDADKIDKKLSNLILADTYFIAENQKTPIDYFIINDRGEYTLLDLLTKIKEGKSPKDIPNLAYYSSGNAIINNQVSEPGEFMSDVINWSDIPFPSENVEFPVLAGSGCQMRCAFCDFINIRDIHVRSVPSLISELKSIPESNGVRNVFFTNDNLFFNVKRTKEITRAIIDAKLNLRWRTFQRVDVVNNETAQLMYESGCREVLLGVESGDPVILRNMKKNTTPERILRAAEAMNKVGINTQSTLIVGFPGETEKTIRNTIDMLNAFETSGPGLHNYVLFLFMVMPLSAVSSRESREKYGLEGYMYNWKHNTMDIPKAKEQMKIIGNSVKSEVSPIYWERPKIKGLSVDEQKLFYSTRNRLMKIQNNGSGNSENENEAWLHLENLSKKIEL